jgi:hypothetical protein
MSMFASKEDYEKAKTGAIDVPLPEPDYASDFAASAKVYQAGFVRQYGQACAKAARDAAVEECANICMEVSYRFLDGTKFVTDKEDGAYECVKAIEAAQKGTA